ncbi:hypothetical protein CTEN210_04471 [Chaetoceros tenuissimus]|uniref:Uncharacterized protein n=1 Tax=Chaetoceros tenuissimus TaxID=426638 RepID=A0AAD3CMV5_9STRA|nr:hypothetical protein CTEN210_04471 [Chaetoceros tenuissimus]
MEAWATKIPQVQFLCISVESKYNATDFHSTLHFKNVVNAYIPSREYFPVGYGQLGCSGFVISDKDGNFVTRKSSAYLQEGENAFRKVESLLQTLLKNDVEDKERLSLSMNHKEEMKSEVEVDSSRIMMPPSSVGVESMDHEHQECTDAFNLAIRSTSFKSFQNLYQTLKSHFDHEEQLLHKYSHESSSSFSALSSHCRDHKRILDIAEAEMKRVNGCESVGS